MALPFLPGYRVEVGRKDRYHKQHMFDVSNGVRVDISRDTIPASQNDHRAAMGIHPLAITAVPKDYKDAMDAKFNTPDATMSRMPAWVAYDRKVLRFYGYFKEAVHSSPSETWRVRKCVIYFYLEDDSMHIGEPNIENSGIPQGVFVKRHRIPKSDNTFYKVDDLYIGAELPVYGRVFRLVDCDVFTRAFYTQNGVDLGGAEDYPLDPFTKKQTSHSHTNHKMMNPLKTYMEASLGRQINQSIEATQKFLRNDGKVLRFYCQWDDDKMYGEKKPYILHFFLADETVEVQEIQQPNSGRDPFPSLLKRQKLPKDFKQIGSDINRIGTRGEESHVQYYGEEDFRVGCNVQVYGRTLLICGADDFTINYYMQNYGLTSANFPRINMDDDPEPISRLEPPPHTGFGSEEDSLGSYLYLMPKVPKQDFKKFMENDGMILRFLGRFINPSKVDAGRRFILNYYLNNDTIQIFEKFERNSGFVGGKFLERDRVKNPATNEYFQPMDLFVGANVEVNKYKFQLLDADEYTRKFMSNNPTIFRPNQVLPGSELAENRYPAEAK
jgi:hypothetical protein